MQLRVILPKQRARTMVPVTRRGNVIYMAGSRGNTYKLAPVVRQETGEIVYACECPDYSGVANEKQFRQSKFETGELCKHGAALRQRTMTESEAR
jgi:hypothetical protein